LKGAKPKIGEDGIVLIILTAVRKASP